MDAQNNDSDLEETPTWAVSIVCFFIFLISFIIDAALRRLTEFLRRRKRKSLRKALAKIKTEMMIMGFISLLLTLSEAPISNICVTESLANSFLPCKDPMESLQPAAVSTATQETAGFQSNTTLSSGNTDELYCRKKGMVSLVSREGVMQLNIFISVLVVFHILFCLLTMFLGMAKMRRWKAWEQETQTLEYQIANDPRRFWLIHETSFGRRHMKMGTVHPLLLWPAWNQLQEQMINSITLCILVMLWSVKVCFVRQFSLSASRADYFTLRDGFIKANVAEGSNFNFQKFLARAFDDHFEQVVGIRFWIWIFSILFIFSSAHGFYNYYWLPFIPLVIVVVMGAKLEIVITQMCMERCKNVSIIQGTFHVKPNDEFFWFGRPKWLLYLLQLVLIQNSFQLAFFTWTWYEYGPRSCFNQEIEEIVIRISMGMVVQFLCGYVTLPLYALVTQMGSGLSRAVFTECVVKGLKNWQYNAKCNLSKNRSISTGHSVNPSPSGTIDTPSMSKQNEYPLEHDERRIRPVEEVVRPTSCEITEEELQQNLATDKGKTEPIPSSEITEEESTDSKIINGGTYDGEISFGSSWKNVDSSRGMQDIDSIVEEDDSECF